MTAEPIEPEPEDYVLQPAGRLGSKTALSIVEHGHVGTYDSDREAMKAALERMYAESFWPNIWRVTDHGNWILLNGDTRRAAPPR